MSARFVNVDWDTPLLLPPSLHDWVRNDDLAHFVLDVVQELDLTTAVVNQRGTGDRQYPPGMMLAVLIYCYSHGIMSSRQIEAATYQHVSVRFLSGNEHPDHDTIATFRRRNRALIASSFRQLLQLAARLKVLQIGTVALDGTKIEAAASKRQTKRRPELEREIEVLDQRVADLLAQAEATDVAEAATPPHDHLPEELVSALERRAKLRAAQAALREQELARAEEAAARRAQSKEMRGQAVPRERPQPPVPPEKQTVNLVDPESTLTPTPRGFIQGYNAQIVMEAEVPCGLILAAEVVRDTNDHGQLEPMLEQAIAHLGQAPARVLVDCGYENYPHTVRLAERHGVEVLLPPAPSAQAKAEPRNQRGWPRQRRAWREQMNQRMSEPETQALYARRGVTVEPTFGTLKTTRGLRRFKTRGLMHVRNEWQLACLAFNFRRLQQRLQNQDGK